ncbi:MAG: hypothetical protein AAB317_04520, partial [Nitrospirota bacterium]
VTDPTPGNNSSTTTTITVITIDAVNDAPTAIVFPAGGTIPAVVSNDTTNGAPAVIGTNVALSALVSNGGLAGLVLNLDGTMTVPANTTPGSYLAVYEICTLPATSSATCDTATVTIVISPAIDAVNDGPTTIPSTGGATASVLGNDTTNGVAATTTNVTLAPGAAPTPTAGSITMSATTGIVTVAANTTPGTYLYPYTICTLPATTPTPTCDTATTTIIVTAPTIDAVDNPTVIIPATGGTIPTVLDNDTTIGTSTVVGVNISAPTLVDNGGLTGLVMNPNGTLTVPANATPSTYTVTYKICVFPATTPETCDTAKFAITIPIPPLPLRLQKTVSRSEATV